MNGFRLDILKLRKNVTIVTYFDNYKKGVFCNITDHEDKKCMTAHFIEII